MIRTNLSQYTNSTFTASNLINEAFLYIDMILMTVGHTFLSVTGQLQHIYAESTVITLADWYLVQNIRNIFRYSLPISGITSLLRL